MRKTYKLYIGGAVPALGIGPLVRRPRRRRDAARQRGPRLPQGRARRGPRGARRLPGLGGEDGHEPGPGPLPRGRAARGPPRAVRGGGRRGGGAGASRRRASRSTGPSTAGSGTPAGRTRSARSWARSTRSAPATSTSASPRRPASSASSRPRGRRCWASCRAWRRSLVGGNTAVVLASETRPLPAVTLARGAGHERRAGRRRQPHHRPAPRARALAGRAHGRQRASMPGACRPTCGPPSTRRPSRTSSASPGRPPGRAERIDWLDDRARPAARVDRRVPGDEDRLAPDRPLSPR